MTEDFKGFNVKITDKENEYNLAGTQNRLRAIFTIGLQDIFHSSINGISAENSILLNDDTPVIVLVDRFNDLTNLIKSYAATASHEAGHAFGLHHQSFSGSNENGEFFLELHPGVGEGPLSWGPIMGSPLTKSLTIWYESQAQNDLGKLAEIINYKKDDHGNTFASAREFRWNTAKSGIIEQPGDVDVFSIDQSAYKKAKRILLKSGGNSDFTIKLFNSRKNLVKTYDNPSSIDIDDAVNVFGTGKIYFQVSINSSIVPSKVGSYIIRVK